MPSKKSNNSTKQVLVKPVPGYTGVPPDIVNHRVTQINFGALREVDRLERLVRSYETLVLLMESKWPKRKINVPTYTKDILTLRMAVLAQVKGG